VSPENDLATYYELKTNKRMTIKHKHTEFELNKQVEALLIVTSKTNYTLNSTLLSLLV